MMFQTTVYYNLEKLRKYFTFSVTASDSSAAFWPARFVNFQPTSATLLLRPLAEDRLKFERLWVRPPRLPPTKSCVENDLDGVVFTELPKPAYFPPWEGGRSSLLMAFSACFLPKKSSF